MNLDIQGVYRLYYKGSVTEAAKKRVTEILCNITGRILLRCVTHMGDQPISLACAKEAAAKVTHYPGEMPPSARVFTKSNFHGFIRGLKLGEGVLAVLIDTIEELCHHILESSQELAAHKAICLSRVKITEDDVICAMKLRNHLYFIYYDLINP